MTKEQLENLLLPRQPKWKTVKTSVPFCPVCREELRGNKIENPWKCSCGEWESDWMNPSFYKIKIEKL